MTENANDEPQLGDTMEIAEAMAIGDVVYFDRTSEGVVMIRVVTEEVLAAYDGPIFLLAGVDASGAASFTPVSRDDVG